MNICLVRHQHIKDEIDFSPLQLPSLPFYWLFQPWWGASTVTWFSDNSFSPNHCAWRVGLCAKKTTTTKDGEKFCNVIIGWRETALFTFADVHRANSVWWLAWKGFEGFPKKNSNVTHTITSPSRMTRRMRRIYRVKESIKRRLFGAIMSTVLINTQHDDKTDTTLSMECYLVDRWDDDRFGAGAS